MWVIYGLPYTHFYHPEGANQQIRHQATHKVGCQPGDFAYGHINLPNRQCVHIYGLTFFHFITPEGLSCMNLLNLTIYYYCKQATDINPTLWLVYESRANWFDSMEISCYLQEFCVV